MMRSLLAALILAMPAGCASSPTARGRIASCKLVQDGDRDTGTAADVVGIAQGHAQGNALRWNYVLALPVEGRTWHVDMDDWMYLIDGKTMLNRTAMSKLGFEVGQMTLAFRKR